MKKVILLILLLSIGFISGWFLREIYISTETIKYQDQLYHQIDDLIEKRIEDSLILDEFNNRKIDEPINVSDIDKMKFTSGGGFSLEDGEYCDSLKTGFYGSYFIIDENYSDIIGRPVGGRITVHSDGKMINWKSTDTNQTIWNIHLESDIISVWDSIHIGLTKSEIESFSSKNNGLCVEIGNKFYNCDFNNFYTIFEFKNDKLKELTITRKCNNKKKRTTKN